MEQLISGISLVMERKDSRRIIILGAAALLLLLFVTQSERNPENILNGGALILATLGSFLGGINLSLAYTYMRLRTETIKPGEARNDIRILRILVGIGSAVSGIAFLSILLGFLGFSAMLDVLPRQGQELGYIGIIILLIATYTLAQRVAKPNLC